jgi:hypothetical protein
MRIIVPLLSLALFAGCSAEPKKEKGPDDAPKGKVVEFDGLKAAAAANWKQEQPPQTPLAPVHVFRVQRVEGDPADAEVRIYERIGGDKDTNLDRWERQFEPPEGKKYEIKIAGRPAYVLDVSGKFRGGPGAPTPREGWRLIGVHFDGPKQPYHVIFRGPVATVEKNKKEFEDWLKSFK